MSKVGIVVPSFNQGKYLEIALKSIVENMKYADIALVVMDGGSTDNSVEIINKYQKYIRYWQSEKDSGQASAINEGMKLLNDCKYVMWLNSDDEYNDEKSVMKIVKFAESTGCEVCYGKSYFIDKFGIKTGTYPTVPYSKKQLQRGCIISQPSVLIKKSAWDEQNGLDERLQMCLDYELWIRLSHKYRLKYVECYIANTRMYKGTKTSKMKKIHLCEAISVLKKQYGGVSIYWIYQFWLYMHDGKAVSLLPMKAVLLFLLCMKKKYIAISQRGCNYT